MKTAGHINQMPITCPIFFLDYDNLMKEKKSKFEYANIFLSISYKCAKSTLKMGHCSDLQINEFEIYVLQLNYLLHSFTANVCCSRLID